MSYDLHKHESLLSNDVLCQAWLKIVIINCGIFRNFKICFSLGKGCGPLFKEIWIPFTQGCFLPSLAVWFWRWPFSFNVFTITLLSLLERGYGPFLNKLEWILFTQDILCKIWNWPGGSGKRFFSQLHVSPYGKGYDTIFEIKITIDSLILYIRFY